MTGKESSQDLEGNQDLVRCSFQLPRELYLILAGLEWGARGLLVTKCVEAGLKQVDRYGDKMAYAIMVKMIGAFCDAIKDTDLVDPQKYIAGFQVIPDEIPGFGTIHFNEVKISMRVASSMEATIRSGRAMGLNIFLPEATNKLGGFRMPVTA